jgi:glycosyltransferase involved in cell wall biosynthesis
MVGCIVKNGEGSLVARCSRQIYRLKHGVAWRIQYRYKLSARFLFARLCDRKSYKWIPVRLNGVQKRIVEGIVSHPHYQKAYGSRRSKKADTISIVIPHYNQQVVLRETIDSVLAQTVQADEIIIVDDSSADRDSTREVLAKYSGDSRFVCHYPDEKLFSGGARNYGADRATGDIIVFVDSDDVLHPQRLEFIRMLFRERNDASFAITGTIAFTDRAPAPDNYDQRDFERSIIEPADILMGIVNNFACSRVSWIDPSTGSVPWYAWGSYGIHRVFQPHSGAISVHRDSWQMLRFAAPKTCVFSPYEDYEYCFLLQALTRGGYQIDLPLIFYRRGFTTHKPKDDGQR